MSYRVSWTSYNHGIFLSCMCINLLQYSGILTITSVTATTTSMFGRNETDRLALLAFKARITHDPLQQLSSWNDSLHFCRWQGVRCGGTRHTQRVRFLDLSSRGIEGSLAPDIGNLSFLREISLQNNSLYGEIPQEVGRLFRLRVLYLSNNSFGGNIPANISRCSKLTFLRLAYNNLAGKIPMEIGSLLKLKGLSIHDNKLSGGIPASLGNLSSLQFISAASNSFDGSIPDDIGRLMSLTTLALGLNKLSGMVPLSVYNLSLIESFDLGGNQLQGSLPQDLGFTLPNLKVFSVQENQFNGPIPVSLSNVSRIEILQIGRNNFTGKVSIQFGGLQALVELHMDGNHQGSGELDDLSFMTSLTNCTNLEILVLDNNRFGGVLPNSIANLSTQLEVLALGDNQIAGSIPTGIDNLIGLSRLGMEYNLLTGSIPTSIGNLRKLQILTLGGNRLSSRIPSSLGNLTLLNTLGLEVSNLHGSIPPSLGNCQKLLLLNLYGNSLTGTIPKQVIGLSSLSIYLDLSLNHLVGSLPLEVGSLKNVQALDVSENKLSGEIPSTLGSCTSLEGLYMEGNFFQGTIPSSLSTLKGLQDLDLSRNNFSGQIPEILETFSVLKNLNLSFNRLIGVVPTKGIFQNASAVSVSGNSMLCGGIPELHLAACPIQKSKKHGSSHTSKLIIIISCSGILVSLILTMSFLILYRGKKRRKDLSSTFSIGDRHQKISYEQILKATNGFSPSNLIGAGSFGSVYKAILNQGEKIVAVKVLNLQQHGASKSFIAECECLRNIRHRNLVKVLTSCSSIDFERNDFKALVFEFMSNGSLERWLHPKADDAQVEQRNLNLLQRLNISVDVASALDYLHQNSKTPIVHCDLKPSNVLLDDDMIAHVGDFGLSRFLLMTVNKSSPSQTSSIGIKGSVGYVAPEYGLGAEVSTRGDVYSYGILLLEMFIGKRPTDDIFKDGLNLHCLAKMALPNRVIEIVDPILLSEEDNEEVSINNIKNRRCMKEKIRECLVSVVRIGVACSTELPRERMDMKDVAKELHLIREIFLGIGIHRKINDDIQETEAWGFVLGLQLVTKFEASGFIIEGDCQSVTKLLLEKTVKPPWRITKIIQEHRNSKLYNHLFLRLVTR